MKWILVLAGSLFLATSLMRADDPAVELGDVNWGRDLAAAKKQSAKTGKPILVLFQEVPGWSTCQDFGNGPLSQPLMVEAIEDLFVPLLVYNNKEEDAGLLKQFGEPSWNNPVVRFLDGQGQDVIERKDGVWKTGPLAMRMAASLKAAGQDVPGYLDSVIDASSDKIRRASFAMAWYWEGEAQLGSLKGVQSTRSVWVGDREVVHLTYDPAVIAYEALLQGAGKMECTSAVYTHDDEQMIQARETKIEQVAAWQDSLETRQVKKAEQKYYLRNTVHAVLPLTGLQAVKMNVAASKNDVAAMNRFLSPRQIRLLKRIQQSIANDSESLKGFGFPEDESGLAAYQQKLIAKLDDLDDLENR